MILSVLTGLAVHGTLFGHHSPACGVYKDPTRFIVSDNRKIVTCGRCRRTIQRFDPEGKEVVRFRKEARCITRR